MDVATKDRLYCIFWRGGQKVKLDYVKKITFKVQNIRWLLKVVAPFERTHKLWLISKVVVLAWTGLPLTPQKWPTLYTPSILVKTNQKWPSKIIQNIIAKSKFRVFKVYLNCLGRNVAFFKTVIAAKWNRSKVLFDIEETFDFLVLRRNYIGVATIGAFRRYFIGLRVICSSWKKYALQVSVIPKRKTEDGFFVLDLWLNLIML